MIRALTINGEGAEATTLSAFDVIDGGGGIDTLNIFTDNDEGINADFPANASVENVEIVNIFNAVGGVAALADASNYAGVQQLWQIGDAADVTNLGASTAAGFRDVDANVSVEAIEGSATIALDGFVGGNDIDVDGEDLASVTIVGTVEEDEVDGTQINLFVTSTGTDVEELTLNTAVDVDLAIDEEAEGASPITSVDASASTGGIEYDAASQIDTIATGSGDDEVEINTDGGDASLSTGAGDDVLIIDTAGGASLNVDAGAGDDEVRLQIALTDVATTDVIVGGDGTDLLVLDGEDEEGVVLVAEDYILLTEVVTEFEAIEFTVAARIDASRMTNYTDITFAALEQIEGINNSAVEVSAAQVLTLNAADDNEAGGSYLFAQAEGYDAGDVEIGDEEFGGDLVINVDGNDDLVPVDEELVSFSDGAVVEAEASNLDLTVTADADDVVARIVGDLETASITLVSNEDGIAAVDVVADDEVLASLTSLTISGAGVAFVENVDGSELVTVDASGLAAADDEGEAEAVLGLVYSSDSVNAETVTLSDGLDFIVMIESTVDAMDTVVGLNLVGDDEGVIDDEASDFIGIVAYDGGDPLALPEPVLPQEGVVFEALGTVTGSSLNTALINALAEADGAVDFIFDYNGDTYVYRDFDDNGTVDDTDGLIKLAGGVDQDLLAQSLFVNYATGDFIF